MAHLRIRYALEPFKTLIRFSPIVGIFGHRQVGKTTFLEGVSKEYKTFDYSHDRVMAEKDPDAFVAGLQGQQTGIDECQLVPGLFPALKERIRNNKSSGQFILSGSVRFYSRQAVRESLTGRIVSIDLLPFTLTELTKEPLPRIVLRLLKQRQFSENEVRPLVLPSRIQRKRTHMILRYMESGGLPGIAFISNARLRNERISEQLQTILDRDIRLVYPTTLPYDKILAFVRAIAETEGTPIQPSILRRLTGIAESTQQKLLHALTSLFVIRLLSIEGDRRGSSVFLEDQAELRYLTTEKPDRARAFQSLVYRNVRAVFNYELGSDWRVFQYRSKAGSLVPFAIHYGADTLGFIPIMGVEPTRAELFAGHSFLRRYGNSKIIFVTQGFGTGRVINNRTIKLPAEILLFEA